eukprot:scaffold1221_cov237-Pinguiococcus_pyrenoidosus.AAC.12
MGACVLAMRRTTVKGTKPAAATLGHHDKLCASGAKGLSIDHFVSGESYHCLCVFILVRVGKAECCCRLRASHAWATERIASQRMQKSQGEDVKPIFRNFSFMPVSPGWPKVESFSRSATSIRAQKPGRWLLV